MRQTPRSPTSADHAAHLRRCIEAVRTEVGVRSYPLAASIVMGDQVLALECSVLPTGTDPTAHPEILALRAATARAGSRYLPGAVLYSTIEPCPMCAAAAVWAKLDGIVFGASQADVMAFARTHATTSLTWRQITIPASDIAAAGTPSPWVLGHVLREECLDLLALTAGRTANERSDG
jgi:tRNA(Arg) A34 adenosine deaminase TadA